MACLDNLVGLRNACGDTNLIESDSGFYLNDLPALDFEGIDNAINKEAESALQEIQRQIGFAKDVVTQEIRGFLKSRYEMPTLIDGLTAGEFASSRTTQAAQAYNVGMEFRMQRNDHAVLMVSQLRLLVNFTGDVDVKLWNLYTGVAEQTETLACVAGVVTTADVYWSMPNNGQRGRYFIGYDATSVPTWQTNIGSDGCNCKGGYINRHEISVNTKKVSGSVLNDNLTPQTGTSGLSVSFSVQCKADYLLCTMKDSLALPVLYKAGANLMGVMQYSRRLNEVIAYRGDYDELREEFEADYKKHMTDILANVQVRRCPCFTGTSQMTFKPSW